jgi:hypothetical protein
LRAAFVKPMLAIRANMHNMRMSGKQWKKLHWWRAGNTPGNDVDGDGG